MSGLQDLWRQTTENDEKFKSLTNDIEVTEARTKAIRNDLTDIRNRIDSMHKWLVDDFVNAENNRRDNAITEGERLMAAGILFLIIPMAEWITAALASHYVVCPILHLHEPSSTQVAVILVLLYFIGGRVANSVEELYGRTYQNRFSLQDHVYQRAVSAGMALALTTICMLAR